MGLSDLVLVWFDDPKTPLAHFIFTKHDEQFANLIRSQLTLSFPKIIIEHSEAHLKHPNRPEDTEDTQAVHVEGLYLFDDFLDANTAQILIQGIDSREWASYSIGRRTQHYGKRHIVFRKTKNTEES